MEHVRFETLGCKLNQIETESLADAFSREGFAAAGAEALTDDEEGDNPHRPSFRALAIPELCVVNTCTVTGKAEQKARRLIRSLLAKYPSAPVLVTGCYAEVEAAAIGELGDRVVVFPGSRKGELALLPRWISDYRLLHPEAPMLAALKEFLDSRRSSPPDPAGTFSLSTDSFAFHSRASIKIQDGCDNRCTYCRIRLARGRAVSLPADEVLGRIRSIERAGWAEVVLTGVNLTQYRTEEGDFADLLGRILAETEGVAVRISSLYPERIDDVLVTHLSNPRIRPHFHLSVQSGSERILRAMKRPYAAETVYRAVERLRLVKDNPFIACDIIAGFPGETDADFEDTLRMCGELRFAGIHAFPFSPRPGTEAWDMKPRVPERIAGERVAALNALAREHREAYEAEWIGKPLRAVTERGGSGGDTRAITENYLTVSLPGESLEPGKAITLIMTSPGTGTLVNGD